MTKGELRTMIREMITEELAKGPALHEEIEGPCYIIKAWQNPARKKTGMPDFDSLKNGKTYTTYDEVLAALNTAELSGLGAYEITWVQSGTKV